MSTGTEEFCQSHTISVVVTDSSGGECASATSNTGNYGKTTTITAN